MTSPTSINIGFLPLLDSALLVAAHEMGFAETENISINLIRETSWANVRDRLIVGHLDASHMLAPMPIASNLELTPLNAKMLAPMALGLGGNAITVSHALWENLKNNGASPNLDAKNAGDAMRQTIANNTQKKLKFGVVHPHSGHNYELRYWLAASGINPDQDIDIVIVPPPLLPDALAQGTVDGFCVGAPWNSVATLNNAGRILTTKSNIWRNSPEKVLGTTTEWANKNRETLEALIRAIYKASAWLNTPSNIEKMAAVLAKPEYLGQSVETISRDLSGQLSITRDETTSLDDFFIPHTHAATFPWQSHALWFYSQMVRWSHAPYSAQNAKIAFESFRPDIYRTALSTMDIPIPSANSKVEGALASATAVGASKGDLMLGPDGFFDGEIFDPEHLNSYINSQSHTKMINK